MKHEDPKVQEERGIPLTYQHTHAYQPLAFSPQTISLSQLLPPLRPFVTLPRQGSNSGELPVKRGNSKI